MSFAILQVHEDCRAGCSHPDCKTTRRFAGYPCPGCGRPLGMDQAFITRGVSVHVVCVVAALLKIAGGGLGVRETSSRVGPTSRVDREVAA